MSSLLIIPREGGYLVRLYIELDQLGGGQRAAELQVTIEQLIARARKILYPYSLEVKEIAWWSVYEIGQRLTAGHGQTQRRVVECRWRNGAAGYRIRARML